ncbi:MAG TPA: hypothetical protein VGC09_21105 [Rhodopila sp.]
MRPHLLRITAAVFVLLLCHAAASPAKATLVRGGRTDTGNPAAEPGGHRLTPGPPPPIPYSLIGAIATETSWRTQDPAWACQMFRSFGRHRLPRFGFSRLPIRVGGQRARFLPFR